MTKNSTPTDLENRIMQLLNSRLMSVTQLAKQLNTRRDILGGYLEALKNQGKLDFYRVGRSNVYTVSGKVKK